MLSLDSICVRYNWKKDGTEWKERGSFLIGGSFDEGSLRIVSHKDPHGLNTVFQYFQNSPLLFFLNFINLNQYLLFSILVLIFYCILVLCKKEIQYPLRSNIWLACLWYPSPLPHPLHYEITSYQGPYPPSVHHGVPPQFSTPSPYGKIIHLSFLSSTNVIVHSRVNTYLQDHRSLVFPSSKWLTLHLTPLSHSDNPFFLLSSTSVYLTGVNPPFIFCSF